MGNCYRRDLRAVTLCQHSHRHGAARDRGEESRLPFQARGAAQGQRTKPADQESCDRGRHDSGEVGAQRRHHRWSEIERHRRTEDHLAHLAAKGDRVHPHAHQAEGCDGDHRPDHPRNWSAEKVEQVTRRDAHGERLENGRHPLPDVAEFAH